MANPKKIEPVHRTIMAFDMEGFGGPQRSNPVRSMMRMGLYGLIREALTQAIGGLGNCSLSDLGDGILVLIGPEVPKNRVVEPFMSDMAAGLKRYNEQTGASAEIRLRAVLHAGEIVEDAQGYSGEALNFAFRLLDSAAVRDALSLERANLGLIVSQHFYDSIIKQGFEGIDPSGYQQVDVRVKETIAKAWVYFPTPRFEVEWQRDARGPAAAMSPRMAPSVPVHKPMEIRDLPPTCLYVSTADVHNYRLYDLHGADVPLRNHLETALLLGRHAVLHCADLYRSNEVARLMVDFEEFIRDGSLLFLLSERVTNPRRDYPAYLEHRIREYGRSPYGGLAVTSFQVDDADTAIERAIAFLEMSPFALHRGYSSKVAFTRAVREDMNVAERIVISEYYGASRIRELTLTLRQYLELTHLEPDGRQRRLLADDEAIGRLQDKVSGATAYGLYSKQLLLRLIQQELDLDGRDVLYEVLAARISIIDLLARIGNLGFIEVTHARDQMSPYFYGHLLNHLGVLVDCPPKPALGVELVDELRSLNWWRFFANYHLRLMADMQARRAGGDPHADPQAMFRGSRLIAQFDDIRAAIRNAWNA